MATDSVGSTIDQNTGIQDSFNKVLKIMLGSQAQLVNRLKTVSVIQPVHNFYYTAVATPSSVNAAIEGATITATAAADLTAGTNWTQIIPCTYGMSKTQIASTYKVGELLTINKERALKKIGLDLEWAVLNGTGLAATTATGGQMKGIRAFAAANTGCSATATSSSVSASAGEGQVNAMLTLMWSYGALADLVICNSTNKGNIDKWTAGLTRTNETKDGRLVAVIDSYKAKTGQVEIMMHAACASTDIYGVVEGDLAIGYLRTLKTEMLAPIQDGVMFDARLEATLECRGLYSAGYVVVS